ncbi:hypothetical protein [Helicobacter mesocricetorum]|uniref:hypothetical protein n=1 Tax=Helicobacter mesocricetorum TaxID=87012 RepID=UPI000CF13DCE|nr:hypothetical protein [Helicobacter mesocricetorum]
MSRLDDILEEQRLEELRQINNRRNQTREQDYGKLEGTLLGIVFNLFAFAIRIAFTIFFTILKWFFYFIIILRNKVLIKWNWYVKTEEIIFTLPWWELWLVIGAIWLSYYGK